MRKLFAAALGAALVLAGTASEAFAGLTWTSHRENNSYSISFVLDHTPGNSFNSLAAQIQGDSTEDFEFPGFTDEDIVDTWALDTFSPGPVTATFLEASGTSTDQLSFALTFTGDYDTFTHFLIEFYNNGAFVVGYDVTIDETTGDNAPDIDIQSYTAQQIPLPPAAWMGLITLGGAAFAGIRRRRKLLA